MLSRERDWGQPGNGKGQELVPGDTVATAISSPSLPEVNGALEWIGSFLKPPQSDTKAHVS